MTQSNYVFTFSKYNLIMCIFLYNIFLSIYANSNRKHMFNFVLKVCDLISYLITVYYISNTSPFMGGSDFTFFMNQIHDMHIYVFPLRG